MAKRLHMTSADYLAIAVSPALVMALVGSLVFFLIEVLYVGEYQARINYVFALFVFAAVLIARIAIEMGSERALLYSVPLAGAVFVVLWRFVEHPSPLSPLINLLLIAIVWFCAHKLTWDCTVIDDAQDASGEGLLQRLGVDQDEEDDHRQQPLNHLASDQGPRSWWRRLVTPQQAPHTPGLWVLYFSLAALPLFGLAQHTIADEGGRRYAFVLLLIYVASGLSLLVTTSFLGLRRYLRQRNVEMPLPIAATWVSVGGVVIAVVMLLAALIPRPSAEFAISQLPYRISSPGGTEATRYAPGNDGADEQEEPGEAVSEREDAPTGDAVDNQPRDETAGGEDGERQGGTEQGDQPSESGERGDTRPGEEQARSENAPREQPSQEPSDRQEEQESPGEDSPESHRAPDEPNRERQSPPREAPSSESSSPPSTTSLLDKLQSLLGGLLGLLKTLFYVALAALALYYAWRYRHELLTAFKELIRDFRAWLARLLGRTPSTEQEGAEAARSVAERRPRFRDFSNPFENGRHAQVPTEELVRYTFDAFVAWCDERGHHRSPDQTPRELLHQAVEHQSPLFREARALVRFYSMVAYSGGRVPASGVEHLREVWRLMGTAAPVENQVSLPN